MMADHQQHQQKYLGINGAAKAGDDFIVLHSDEKDAKIFM